MPTWLLCGVTTMTARLTIAPIRYSSRMHHEAQDGRVSRVRAYSASGVTYWRFGPTRCASGTHADGNVTITRNGAARFPFFLGFQ